MQVILLGDRRHSAGLDGPLGCGRSLTAGWLGSRPITHVAAGGVAVVGEIDAALLSAIERLRACR